MPQQRSKIPHSATEIWCRQIYKYFFKKKLWRWIQKPYWVRKIENEERDMKYLYVFTLVLQKRSRSWNGSWKRKVNDTKGICKFIGDPKGKRNCWSKFQNKVIRRWERGKKKLPHHFSSWKLPDTSGTIARYQFWINLTPIHSNLHFISLRKGKHFHASTIYIKRQTRLMQGKEWRECSDVLVPLQHSPSQVLSLNSSKQKVNYFLFYAKCQDTFYYV